MPGAPLITPREPCSHSPRTGHLSHLTLPLGKHFGPKSKAQRQPRQRLPRGEEEQEDSAQPQPFQGTRLPKALSGTHPLRAHSHPGCCSSLSPRVQKGPPLAQRGGHTCPRLTAGSCPGPPESPVREGKCSPREEKVQHLLGGPKSPVGAQECGEEGGVPAQEGGHQVGHRRLQSASLDAPRPAGLIPVPRGHTRTLGWNTAETRVRGGTKGSRKAGAGPQTEPPSVQDSGQEEGQDRPPQEKRPGITSELALGRGYVCERLGALCIGQLPGC